MTRRHPPREVCEECGQIATDYKLDGLADPHYFCPAHASPPRRTFAAICGLTFTCNRNARIHLQETS